MKKIKLVRSLEEKPIKDAFTEFIRSCKIKNLSEHTIEYYETYMTQFTKYLDMNGITIVGEINQRTIDDYTLYLKDAEVYKDVTINTNLRAVRAIVYYFQGAGYCSQFKIKMIKANKEIKEPYTQQELKLLLEKPKTNLFSEYRNWVIINFLLSTGVRIGELVGIQVKDIDLEEAIVKVKRGKSRRERHIPLSKTMQKILAEYLELRQYEDLSDYLFCNSYGGKLREDSCKHSISKYNRSRGVQKISVHLFRHTFAKSYILNGGDIFRLQKILGHKGIEIVKEYVSMFSNDLKQDFDRFNPLERIASKGEYIRFS